MSEWQPIETVPKHVDVLFYREDAGVFAGQYTYCAEWVSEREHEEWDEETLWSEDCWAYLHDGAHRCDGDLKPTHWMPLPKPPVADCDFPECYGDPASCPENEGYGCCKPPITDEPARVSWEE